MVGGRFPVDDDVKARALSALAEEVVFSLADHHQQSVGGPRRRVLHSVRHLQPDGANGQHREPTAFHAMCTGNPQPFTPCAQGTHSLSRHVHREPTAFHAMCTGNPQPFTPCAQGTHSLSRHVHREPTAFHAMCTAHATALHKSQSSPIHTHLAWRNYR